MHFPNLTHLISSASRAPFTCTYTKAPQHRPPSLALTFTGRLQQLYHEARPYFELAAHAHCTAINPICHQPQESADLRKTFSSPLVFFNFDCFVGIPVSAWYGVAPKVLVNKWLRKRLASDSSKVPITDWSIVSKLKLNLKCKVEVDPVFCL